MKTFHTETVEGDLILIKTNGHAPGRGAVRAQSAPPATPALTVLLLWLITFLGPLIIPRQPLVLRPQLAILGIVFMVCVEILVAGHVEKVIRQSLEVIA